MFGIPIRKNMGTNMGSLAGAITTELARGSASVALTLDAHWLATDPIYLLALRSKKEVFA